MATRTSRKPARRTASRAARRPARAARARPPAKRPARAARRAPLRPREVVRRIEQAWNAGRLDELDRYFSPSFQTDTGPPGLPPGLATAKMAHQMSLQAFPDRKIEILDIIEEGDKVAVRCQMTGTNTGGLPWLGVPANDAKVAIQWISLYQVKNGKVVAHWAVNDGIALLVQVDAMRPPGSEM